MYSCVLILVTGIIQVLALPLPTEDNTINPNYNMFLLPTEMNSIDTINITIATKSVTDKMSISLMGIEDKDTKTNGVICSIKADMNSQVVTIFKERDEPVDEAQIEHFFLDDDKTVFNMWLTRRVDPNTEESNVLEVYTKSSAFKSFTVKNIDEIRYLKISGNEAKITNLDFKFV